MIQVWDTETTGLPLFREPSSDPRQPHLVQIASLLLDQEGRRVDAFDVIIKPDGWTIPDDVAAIHGITTERALAEGIPLRQAMALFGTHRSVAKLRVAHNASFDDRIMRIALLRSGLSRDEVEAMERQPVFCTCNASKSLVNLPPTARMKHAGFTGPKSPKLAEAIKHFFDEEMQDAHTAGADAANCARLFLHLKGLGLTPKLS